MDLEDTNDLRSSAIWTRTTFRLKLESGVGSDVRAYAGLKIYTSEFAKPCLRLNEAYIDYYGGKYDLRGGLQVLSWGTAYQINPTNVINPYDLTEEAVFIPEERLGVVAARMNYYPLTNFALTGIYIPCFVPAYQPEGIDLPERTVENSEYALKLTARSIAKCDLSLSYFSGKDDFPWINGQYRFVRTYGADIIGTVREVAFWAEGAYTQPEMGDCFYEVAAGGEYTLGSDLYLMSQLYHRNYPESKENYLMAVARYPFLDVHTLQFGVAYEMESELYIVFPEITLSLSDAASLKMGGIYVSEQGTGSLSSQIRNRAFVELEYCF
jgi:hypothetical protein